MDDPAAVPSADPQRGADAQLREVSAAFLAGEFWRFRPEHFPALGEPTRPVLEAAHRGLLRQLYTGRAAGR
ncbi:hypothetical protein [Streptomyces sp. NPDC047928]|uniref:hypothetical protein n=1 Tax=unclassified Streptomyces TaxID=2593676 RepID=UPI003714E4BF